MNRIAVFGKPGGGKSTLSSQLSAVTGIPLYPLDLIKYKENGDPISHEEYSQKHAELLNFERWLIEGLGTIKSFWERIDAADTLIYIDLPYYIHYWWVTKRLLKSFIVKPEGWPKGSSVLKGTLASWKYLRLSPKFWTPELFEEMKRRCNSKNIYRITSVKEMNHFVKKFERKKNE